MARWLPSLRLHCSSIGPPNTSAWAVSPRSVQCGTSHGPRLRFRAQAVTQSMQLMLSRALLEAEVARSLGPLRQSPTAYTVALVRIAVYGHTLALLLAMRVHSPAVVLSTSIMMVVVVIVSLALAGISQPNAESGNAATGVAPAAAATHHQRRGLCATVCTVIMAPITLPAFALTAVVAACVHGPCTRHVQHHLARAGCTLPVAGWRTSAGGHCMRRLPGAPLMQCSLLLWLQAWPCPSITRSASCWPCPPA